MLRLRTYLATGELKHAELTAWRCIRRRHFEAAPKIDKLNLAALNLGHVAPPHEAGAQHSQSPTDAQGRTGDKNHKIPFVLRSPHKTTSMAPALSPGEARQRACQKAPVSPAVWIDAARRPRLRRRLDSVSRLFGSTNPGVVDLDRSESSSAPSEPGKSACCHQLVTARRPPVRRLRSRSLDARRRLRGSGLGVSIKSAVCRRVYQTSLRKLRRFQPKH